jgi:formiminoglutamase
MHVLSTWAPSRRIDIGELKAVDLGDVDDPDRGEEGEWRVRMAAESGKTIARLLLVIGGDNSVIAPVATAVLGDLALGGLVVLDVRHDVRGGDAGNASVVRRLLDAGMPGERIVQVGVADWADSRSYYDEAYARGIHPIHREEVARRGISDCVLTALDIAAAGGRRVVVALDLDVCDRAVAPACPGSLPGGLSAAEVLRAAYLAGMHASVDAVAVTEVDAAADSDGRTVRLAAMCLLEAAAGLAGRPVGD